LNSFVRCGHAARSYRTVHRQFYMDIFNFWFKDLKYYFRVYKIKLVSALCGTTCGLIFIYLFHNSWFKKKIVWKFSLILLILWKLLVFSSLFLTWRKFRNLGSTKTENIYPWYRASPRRCWWQFFANFLIKLPPAARSSLHSIGASGFWKFVCSCTSGF
jgi:glycosyltransferase involved in cell wall biosynthesis